MTNYVCMDAWTKKIYRICDDANPYEVEKGSKYIEVTVFVADFRFFRMTFARPLL